ncbi:helix-turn-helix transcriptional regulator [Thermopolyspora sp. NPDC052614]|uniref:helix-turn-helix domain-containing protein n=1 Tax=Thermopolyspora sp. NPDC052614 TaxID=3155682 RepID=UPI003429C154
MSLGPNPIGRRRRLGAELCDLRQDAEIDPDELARQLGWPKGKVRRLETARVRPNLGEIMDLLDALGVTGLRRDYILELAREAAHSLGWRDAYDDPAQHDQHTLAELANTALELWDFQLTLFPGLLQCPEYARARFASRPSLGQAPVDVEAAVHARMARQQVLTRETPFHYDVILDETLLVRHCGPPGTRTAQLDYTVRLAELPTVTVRVLPFDRPIAKHYLPATSFVYFRLADPVDPELVVLDIMPGSLILGDKEDVSHYKRLFDRLRAVAFSPEDSLALLREARDNPEEGL